MTNYVYSAIDTIQYAKTSLLNTLVKEEAISKPLQNIINAEAMLARNIVNAASDITEAFTKVDFFGKFLNSLTPATK